MTNISNEDRPPKLMHIVDSKIARDLIENYCQDPPTRCAVYALLHCDDRVVVGERNNCVHIVGDYYFPQHRLDELLYGFEACKMTWEEYWTGDD